MQRLNALIKNIKVDYGAILHINSLCLFVNFLISIIVQNNSCNTLVILGRFFNFFLKLNRSSMAFLFALHP